jgi:hypothetical protein
VETPEFLRRARAHLTEAERFALIDRIAASSETGTSLGAGLWKLRSPRQGGGKRGGFRVVYVFGGVHMPIFLITLFAKNERDNLSPTELAAAAELSRALISSYGDPHVRS